MEENYGVVTGGAARVHHGKGSTPKNENRACPHENQRAPCNTNRPKQRREVKGVTHAKLTVQFSPLYLSSTLNSGICGMILPPWESLNRGVAGMSSVKCLRKTVFEKTNELGTNGRFLDVVFQAKNNKYRFRHKIVILPEPMFPLYCPFVYRLGEIDSPPSRHFKNIAWISQPKNPKQKSSVLGVSTSRSCELPDTRDGRATAELSRDRKFCSPAVCWCITRS